jgi:hypothetical protein
LAARLGHDVLGGGAHENVRRIPLSINIKYRYDQFVWSGLVCHCKWIGLGCRLIVLAIGPHSHIPVHWRPHRGMAMGVFRSFFVLLVVGAFSVLRKPRMQRVSNLPRPNPARRALARGFSKSENLARPSSPGSFFLSVRWDLPVSKIASDASHYIRFSTSSSSSCILYLVIVGYCFVSRMRF